MPQELCPTCSGLGCGTCFGSGKVEAPEVPEMSIGGVPIKTVDVESLKFTVGGGPRPKLTDEQRDNLTAAIRNYWSGIPVEITD